MGVGIIGGTYESSRIGRPWASVSEWEMKWTNPDRSLFPIPPFDA
jgi:hypothetical protein